MLTERGGDIELVAPRGIDFYASIPVILFFGVLTVVLVVKGLRGEVKPREAAVYAVPFGSFAALGLAGLIYYRTERRFVMDSAGVRMSRGRRVQRNLAWGEITEIRVGAREVMAGGVSLLSSRILPFFQVRTSRLWRRIYFDGRSSQKK